MHIPIVQHVDKPATTRSFGHLKDDELLVASMFKTIQGEGPFAGRPSVFVRLSGCNFGDKNDHCQFCDTDFRMANGKIWTVEKLAAEVSYMHQDVAPALGIPLTVITGGEPTLQPALTKLVGLLEGQVQIETNGTQSRAIFEMSKAHPQHLYMVISPKASRKTMKYAFLSDEVLFAHGDRCLKFVVDSDADSEHHLVPEWAIEWSKQTARPLYVSPMAVYSKSYDGEVSSAWEDGLIDRPRTAANYSYAARYAMQIGAILSIQQHLFAAIA